MKRNAFLLAAAFAELLRFIAVAFLAGMLGQASDGGAASALFRYEVGAQLLFPLGLFFLWFDEERYDSYKIFLVAGKLVSIFALLPLLFRLFLSALDGPARLHDPWTSLLLAGLCGCIDFSSLAILIRSFLKSVARDVPEKLEG